MNNHDKIRYIFNHGRVVLPESVIYKRVTAAQIQERLNELLPDGCEISQQAIMSWYHNRRENPLRENRIAVDVLYNEVKAKVK